METDSLWSALEQQLLPAFTHYRQRLAELPIQRKADQSLVTEADINIQRMIIQNIRDMDSGAVVIAEEEEPRISESRRREDILRADGRVWIIDPIDGTAEFVRDDRIEFCSVVCLYEDWEPKASFILAPELGKGRTSLLITADRRTSTVRLNGAPAPLADRARNEISATRGTASGEREFDAVAERMNYQVKTRTTSQTLDMLRTAINLADYTEPALLTYDLFWRRQQKIWDGAAGLCLADVLRLRRCDEHGFPLPSGPDFLSSPTPLFDSTVMGLPETVDWFLGVEH
ncbi:inositol monophosphatase family protein [Nonomuraea sp. NPDC004702]